MKPKLIFIGGQAWTGKSVTVGKKPEEIVDEMLFVVRGDGENYGGE